MVVAIAALMAGAAPANANEDAAPAPATESQGQEAALAADCDPAEPSAYADRLALAQRLLGGVSIPSAPESCEPRPAIAQGERRERPEP